MRKYVFALMLAAAAGSTLLIAAFATAGGGTSNFGAHGGLIGYQEVPAVSTSGGGSFEAKLNSDGTAIDWTMSYDLEGAVQQSHIHFGQRSVNGGISVFLCTNLGNGPAGTQACPAAPATISGTIMAADVSPNIPATAGARTQGINTGEFEELVRAIRAGAAYANVHSTTWPGGEIRGQLADPNGK
jgi:hypothetical protein